MAFAGVRLDQLVWTRGKPKVFTSSAIAERGFCAECGTPLTYRVLDRDRVAVTIGSLDAPAAVAPTVQYGVESKLAWLDSISVLPPRDVKAFVGAGADVASRQHPDHDT